MTRTEVKAALLEIAPKGSVYPLSGYPFAPEVVAFDADKKTVCIDNGMSRYVELGTYDNVIRRELEKRFPGIVCSFKYYEDW